MTIIQETNLPNMLHRGKVRDTYGLDGGLLLMVATDRISAFDVILPSAIPDKGAVLSQLSAFWFEKTSHIVSHHLVDLAFNRKDLSLSDEIARRSMVVRKAQRIDVECIVRGYITGSTQTSLWTHYKNGSRNYCGIDFKDGNHENFKIDNLRLLCPNCYLSYNGRFSSSS